MVQETIPQHKTMQNTKCTATICTNTWCRKPFHNAKQWRTQNAQQQYAPTHGAGNHSTTQNNAEHKLHNNNEFNRNIRNSINNRLQQQHQKQHQQQSNNNSYKIKNTTKPHTAATSLNTTGAKTNYMKLDTTDAKFHITQLQQGQHITQVQNLTQHTPFHKQ